jgi:hypothetical protein
MVEECCEQPLKSRKEQCATLSYTYLLHLTCPRHVPCSETLEMYIHILQYPRRRVTAEAVQRH